jgi:putative peptidoglycan lipid II flippase
MDAFLVAFRIPNLVRDLFAEGALSAAFVPAFTRSLATDGRPEAWRLARNVITALTLATTLVVAAMWLFAEPLVRAYAGDFAEVPGKLMLTVHLARIMLPFLVLVALAAVAMGMLNALNHYFVPSLSPAAFNVASIACALMLVPLMHAIGQPPIVALAIGALLGGLGQVAVQWPALRAEGFRFRPALDLEHPGLRQVLLAMGPGTIGLAATQVNLFVTTLLATGEGTGAVSWLQYAFRLMYLPIGLFGVSIATAILPTVSRHLAMRAPEAAAHTVTRGMGMMLVVNIPASVGLFMLATPIVEVLLERGRFLPSDTLATATAVRCYAVGLVGYSAARISVPVFYAHNESRTAVTLSVIAMGANLLFSLMLAVRMGFSGLALATSLAALLNGSLAFALLVRRAPSIDVRHLAATAGKTLLAASAMALVVWGTLVLSEQFLPGDELWRRALRLLIEIAAGLATFALTAQALGVEELTELRETLRARLRRP